MNKEKSKKIEKNRKNEWIPLKFLLKVANSEDPLL